MAIQLEFINVIAPIQTIWEWYPSGWAGFLRDHASKLGRVAWYDDHLVRVGGAMEPAMVEGLIAHWTQSGFQATERVCGNEVWRDFCVVDSFGNSLHRCDWLMFDSASRTVWLAGTSPGRVVGRDDFQRRG